ncbi:MAG: 50S ribosomal protein L9 [Fimbriimonadaceae bacterium]|nr:50S ribosomal protein L9 [Fimbriimonadaceae bacterium]QYK55182.1 MAG: 50S ribosomal protein L9 [Fimbriimonadaceae bacterium]
MKVILKQSVPKVGKEGQVVNVKDGFARNYLFPRGIAIVADKAQMGVLDRRNARLEAKLAETKSDAEKLRDVLHGKVLEIEGQVAKGSTKLFGAITSQDIADAIKANFGVDFEKKVVLLAQPIKQLGNHTVDLDVHRLVDIRMTVHVFDPEALAAAKAKAAADAANAPKPKVEAPVEAEAADAAETPEEEA